MRFKGMNFIPIAATLAMAAVLALAASACGKDAGGAGDGSPGAQLDPFELVLDFYPNPDHAGVYMGLSNGAFEQAGLDVTVQSPTDPAAPIKQVAAGEADLAISYEPEVVLARDRGLDVVAVGALVDQPLTSMIWLPESGIRQISDLRGKTVATAGISYQDAYLNAILERANVPRESVNRVSVGLNLLPALMSGRADALLGAFRNIEGVELKQRRQNPTIVPVNELGVPTYDELVLVANATTLEEDGEAIRLFLAALERATRAAVSNPEEATRTILQANSALEPALTAAWMDATLPLLAPEPGAPYAGMNADQWNEFIAWMRDQGLIESFPDAGEAMTNAYIPDGVPAAEE